MFEFVSLVKTLWVCLRNCAFKLKVVLYLVKPGIFAALIHSNLTHHYLN